MPRPALEIGLKCQTKLPSARLTSACEPAPVPNVRKSEESSMPTPLAAAECVIGTVTVSDLVVTRPATSRAVTVTVCAPGSKPSVENVHVRVSEQPPPGQPCGA